MTDYVLLVFTNYPTTYFYCFATCLLLLVLFYFTTSTTSTTSTTTSISLPSFVFPSSPTTANTSTVASVQRYRSSFLPALDQGEFLAIALPNLRDLHKFHTMRLLTYYLELITFDGHSQFNQISRTSIWRIESVYGALAGLSKIIYDATSFGYVALLDSAVQSFTVGSMTKQDASR